MERDPRCGPLGTLAWLSKCRAILIRWEKTAYNYLGLLKLAFAVLWYRRVYRLIASEPTDHRRM